LAHTLTHLTLNLLIPSYTDYIHVHIPVTTHFNPEQRQRKHRLPKHRYPATTLHSTTT
jgi:hypothetical protein